jgi:hypothetical protein
MTYNDKKKSLHMFGTDEIKKNFFDMQLAEATDAESKDMVNFPESPLESQPKLFSL